jgi:L-asparaginase II
MSSAMSKSPVVIEVTRGPVVESRHEGIAAIMKPDGSVVASWGDIDHPILPRSANKPIQAMAFVESGAVERFGLGNEHISLACASHLGEKRHVETVRAWLKKVGLGEDDLECGTHAPRLQGTIEELVREGKTPTAAFNNCSGKHTGMLTTAVQYGEPTKGYIKYDHPVQCRLREVMSDLCGIDANGFPHGTDGCGIPTLATPLKRLAQAMASMADPSRLSNKHAEAAARIRAAMNAEPFLMAGTGSFGTRINTALPGVAQVKGGAEGVFCGMLPTLGLGIALKMWDGAGRASEIAMATLLGHLGVLPAGLRDEIVHPPVRNVVGLLVGEMRPAKSWLG